MIVHSYIADFLAAIAGWDGMLKSVSLKVDLKAILFTKLFTLTTRVFGSHDYMCTDEDRNKSKKVTSKPQVCKCQL